MKRLISAIVIVSALTACGKDQPITPEEARLALPSSSAIQIGTPENDQSTALTAAAAKEPSALFAATVTLAAGVNGGTAVTLAVLQAVVHLPPTSCTVDSCTWGPASGVFDLNEHKLVVTRVGDHYDYALSAEPKSKPGSGFLAYLTGTAFPGASPYRGHGTFTVDFDLAATLDHLPGWHQTDWGKLTITYDNRVMLSIDATFLGAKNFQAPGDPANQDYPARINAAYVFRATNTGGDLQVAARTLPPATEKFTNFHSRWTATGSGRGDARLVEGTSTSNWSQCWLGYTQQFQLAYDSLNPQYPDASACSPFGDADYGTLTAP